MPYIIQDSNTNGVITYYYTDPITKNPITVAKTETQTVNAQSCVLLKEIPYRYSRVNITSSEFSYLIEVNNPDEITSVYNYYVDYNKGMVYFHVDAGSKSFTFTYQSIGYVYITSTRIATQWNGSTVIETLQDMMDTMNHAILVSTTYATADDLIKDIEARTLACKNSIDTKIAEANSTIDSKVSSANSSVDSKITQATNKITEVNTVITNANTAKTDLQATIDNGNINNYQLKTDNTLATTSKTIVGAINENKTAIDGHTTTISNHTNQLTTLNGASAVPDYVGNITITIPIGNGDFEQLIPHNLGVKPKRVQAYIRNDGKGYVAPFPITKATYTTEDAIAFRELGRIGADSTNIKISFIRKSPYIGIEEIYTIDYYLYLN